MQKNKFDKVQHPFIIKTPQQIRNRREPLYLTEGTHETPTANIMFNGEICFPVTIRNKTYLLTTFIPSYTEESSQGSLA